MTLKFIQKKIDFENIGKKEVIVNKIVNAYAVIAFIAIFALCIFLLIEILGKYKNSSWISGLSSGITIAFILWSKQKFQFSKVRVIQGSEEVCLFYGKKQCNLVDEFIIELQNKKVEFIRSKYMSIDFYTLSEELRSKFIWLKNSDYITNQELHQLILELEDRKILKGF